MQGRTEYGSRTSTAAWGAQLHPVADPNCKLVGFKTGFQDTARLCLGWIVDGTGIANCYRVQVEKMHTPVMASAVTSTSNSCFGATEITSFVPGTPVIVMLHDKITMAQIIGAAPTILDIGYRGYHDYITQASRKRVDDCHKKYLKLPEGGQVSDYSAWRPIDGTLASEWGAITTTGLGVTLDDFMVKMSVNEFTGVFGFYHDSMLRLSGYNMQVWTGGAERDAYVDQGEYNDTQGYSPYPWEAMGILQPGTKMVQEYEIDTYLCSNGHPYYAHFENRHEFQQPYHRSQVFMGYLGQGARQVVHAPPAGLNRWTYKPGGTGNGGAVFDSELNSDLGAPPPCVPGEDKDRDFPNEDKPAYGLFEENTGLDGRHFMASAKGITIAKRMLLPMPTRLKRAEAGDGDSAEKNYKAASKFGSGPEHKITGDLKTDSAFPNLQRASGLLDLHGYLFNYSGLHPFHWHTKDYKTWEQEELKYAEYNQVVPDYSSLQGSMYLEQPKPKQLEIDHRYKQQDFYETEAYISLLEDGSVVIGDGYGAEIRMSGGCLTLSAPGDVWVKSGRHAQTWAGGDVIQRANGAVDISTTEKSVRIKAEQNVMILAGNDSSERDGGVLIESRSSKTEYDFDKAGDDVRFGGVVLRAPKSNVVGLAHQVYMRTGGGDSGIAPGNITIDAGRGEASLITKSNDLYHYVGESGAIGHFFRASADSETQQANYFTRDYTLLAGPMGLDGALIANGLVIANGSVIAAAGAMVADQGSPYVAPCDNACKSQVDSALEEIRQYADQIIPDAADLIDKTYLDGLWYSEKRPGNSDTIKKIEFSFRTDTQYKVPDFLLFEDRWQQLARLAGKIPAEWKEKPVKTAAEGDTYPFPGRKKLTEEDVFVTQDFTIVENSGGKLRDKKRNSGTGGLADEYLDPKFDSSKKKKINAVYPIIGSSDS